MKQEVSRTPARRHATVGRRKDLRARRFDLVCSAAGRWCSAHPDVLVALLHIITLTGCALLGTAIGLLLRLLGATS